MSIIQTELVTCPACNFLQERQVARSVNAQRAPHLRDQVLAGTLQRTVCDGCHRPFELAGRFLYVDFARGHWFGVLPRGEAVVLAEEEALLAQTFRKAVLEAPLVVRELGATARVRMVFGVDDLREKVVVFDAGLDDLAVERLKLLMNAEAPAGFELEQGARLSLRAADGAWLSFEWVARDEVRRFDWPVARALYDDVVANEDAALRSAFDGLLWVDARRLLPA